MHRALCYMILGILPLTSGLLARAGNPPPQIDRPRAPISTDPIFMKAIALADDIASPEDRALALSRIARDQAAAGDQGGSRRAFALAISLVDDLSSDQTHYQPHILTWIGQSQLKAGDRAGAIASYRKAIGLISSKPPKSGLFDFNKYFNLIPDQVKAGDLAGARETVEKARQAMANAKNRSLDYYHGVWMVHLEALVGDFDPAFQAIAANEADPHPQPHFKVEALEGICRSVGYAEPADGTAALDRVLSEVAKSKGINMSDEANIRLGVAEAAAKIGAIDLALRAVDSINDLPSQVDQIRSNRGRVLTEIAMAQAKAGRHDQAKATLARAIKVAETLGAWRNGVLRYVQEAQIELGDFTEALQPLAGESPQTLLSRRLQVARLQEKAGDRDAVRKTLTQALAEAETYLRDLKPEPPQSPQELRYSIPRPSFEERKGFSLSQIAILKAEIDDFDGALAIAQTAEDPMTRRTALSAVAAAQGRSGQVDAAATWIRGLKDPEDRTWCVQALASGLVARYAPPEPASQPKR